MKTLMHRWSFLVPAVFIALSPGASVRAANPDKPELLVLAAASLTNVLDELSAAWTATSGVKVKLSYAASSVLARQIEAGGKADVFISADQEWMDYLVQRGLVEKRSRRNLVGNQLVLIAPADSALVLKIAPGFDIVGALKGGRLATGDPDTVPVGRYARSSLTTLGVWDDMADRLVRADNVRGAMMLVARGEVPLGIVYATDALLDKKVRIVDTFPESTHAPIAYPGAAVKAARPEATAFLTWLGGSAAVADWKKYGFLELKK